MSRNNSHKFIIISLILLVSLTCLYLWHIRKTGVSDDFFAMDTIMSLQAYGKDADKAVSEAREAILGLDAALSVTNKDSSVYRLNSTGSCSLNEDLQYLLERSIQIQEMTGGAFNICIYPIMKEWGFTEKNYKVPEKAAISELCKLVDGSKITIDTTADSVSLSEDAMIDLGGIAKGYASMKARDILKAHGINSALINLGGNVCAVGKKPDGSPFSIAIKDPEPDDTGENTFTGVLKVSDKCVITSGGYERYFEEDGVTYHHIIDPSTGYPAASGLKSVTVVSDDPTLADALSTAVYVMGKDRAVDLWRTMRDRFDLVLLSDTGQLYITEGLKDCFSSKLEYYIID